MPASKQKPAPPAPPSPRNIAKYTNKDGSKFITVPKGTASDSSQPSTPTTSAKPNDQPAALLALDASAPTVNRKKQKRRQKAAAKAAAELAANGHANSAPGPLNPQDDPVGDHDAVTSDDEADDPAAHGVSSRFGPNGHPDLPTAKSKKNKKKKKKNAGVDAAGETPSATTAESPVNAPVVTRGPGMSRDKIWSTSNHEERERIKEFWLGLGEEERKSLVKVEKDAVLRKMKEQQKHTCSCTVCGRKRTAIEEELEGLYDAYYLELEQFANQGEGPPLLPPPPRDFPIRPPRRLPARYATQPPSHGRIVEHVGDEDEEELDEVYSEDEVDGDEFSDDEPPEEFHSAHDRDVADFLTFGNSLQVKGGILTVADDLLKNDGKRFIEMMEQLAERRMAREEDAREHFSRTFGHPNGSYSAPHNHPPPEEDEYEEEEEEEDDYEDSQEEEYEDEEDQMTEEQRMEEGRRMFQIFAARMFEQRVLSAYKEKVAKERQQKLLEELEEESRQVDEQRAKRAKNAQKKKDKAAQKKQVLAEEKARRDAERIAEETARVEAEQRKAAEQRQKAEEKRRQKEAQRKAEEEARLKKEAERQRRLHEQREKQAEQERKVREAKERERQQRVEQRLREKELREQREREAQERKDKQERDKREKEARATAAKAQREAQAAAGARERRGQHQHHPVSIPTIPVATPAIPKAPTPMRTRTMSQQQQQAQQQETGQASSAASQAASGPSQNPSPHSATPVRASPGPIGQERKASGGAPPQPQPQHLSPQNSHPKPPSQTPPFQVPPMAMQPPPGLAHQRPPGFPGPMAHDPLFSLGFRPGPNVMMPPPGINGPGGPPGVEQFPLAQGFAMPKEIPPPTHPIGRPAPIGRPGSISHGLPRDDDDNPKRLGSRVLVEDDEPLSSDVNLGSLRHHPPGPRGGGFATSPFMDAGFPVGHSPWGLPGAGAQPFPPPGFGTAAWGSPTIPPGFSVGSPAPGLGSIRASAQPRHVAVRLMLCQACKDLASTSSADADGYIDLGTIKSQIEAQTGDASIMEQDLLNLCDTEGNGSNGGGTFDVRRGAGSTGTPAIRWAPDAGDGLNPHFRAQSSGEAGERLQNCSPSKRMTLLERIGITSRGAATRPLSMGLGNGAERRAASTSVNDAAVAGRSSVTRRAAYATREVDTWGAFYNVGSSSRRFQSEL
ncbi:salt tolerance down-regulator domain-containing protein [Hirsutella rhossiliensis]|uniref:Stress response protein NST1 n=1 Tax=Hirsutella rhossiliensis TaxID=111463 RepID=A0A9P8NC29_9HYPO|nr:salt tolerance down-regulator domain-containing protein [Hirsutella rhossiliensis]KAH0968412.1 salt tolerance down-regulator domain-containing protein [Hirsutella rhossiliensis]